MIRLLCLKLVPFVLAQANATASAKALAQQLVALAVTRVVLAGIAKGQGLGGILEIQAITENQFDNFHNLLTNNDYIT